MSQRRQFAQAAGAATTWLHADRATVRAVVATLAVLGTLLLTMASSAFAQTIHGCYNNRTGALRRISSGHCRHDETALNWNEQGAEGATGAAGMQGVRGATGEAGINGATGLNGVTGAAGQKGATGATGSAGPAGLQGVTGAAGPTGAKGATGPSGTAGTNGATGPTGPAAGNTGPAGPTGAAGSFPGTLPSGQSETGTWVASDDAAPAEKGQTVGVISFPVPLSAVLGSTKVKYNTVAAKTSTGCTGTVESPTAAKGDLCVYAGLEELSPHTSFKGIQSTSGGAGSSLGGAFVVFEASENEPASNLVKVQGTWAVTAE